MSKPLPPHIANAPAKNNEQAKGNTFNKPERNAQKSNDAQTPNKQERSQQKHAQGEKTAVDQGPKKS